jgi:hypothetical protein
MTEEFNLDPYVGALREDFPSVTDEARIHRKLVAAGLGVSLALATKAAVAGSAWGKVGLVSSLTTRFMNLSLLSQFAVATATMTAAVTGPVWVATHWSSSAHGNSVKGVAATASKAMQGTGQQPAPHAREAPATAASAADAPLEAPFGRFVPGAARAQAVSPVQQAAENSALAEEARLIDLALSAIRAGELDLATQLLDEHAARFPIARLAREQQRARQKLEEARGGITR